MVTLSQLAAVQLQVDTFGTSLMATQCALRVVIDSLPNAVAVRQEIGEALESLTANVLAFEHTTDQMLAGVDAVRQTLLGPATP